MKSFLFLVFSISTCIGSPDPTIPLAIPLKRSSEQPEAAYQLPAPHADEINRALRHVKGRSQPENTRNPAEVLWVPIPIKHGKENGRAPILPIPITQEMKQSQSPFKIVIVNSDKHKGSTSGFANIDQIENLLAQLEPLSQNMADLPVQQHRVNIKHDVKKGFQAQQEVRLPPQIRPEVKFPPRIQPEVKFPTQIPPEPFRESSQQIYRGREEDKQKQKTVFASKQVKSTISYRDEGQKSQYGGQGEQRFVPRYEEQDKRGRSHGGFEGPTKPEPESFVRVEVNNYGNPARPVNGNYEDGGKRFTQDEGSKYRKPVMSFGKLKPLGKAEVHVTVHDEQQQDRDDRFVQSSSYSPIVPFGPEEYGGGGYQSSTPKTGSGGYGEQEDGGEPNYDGPIRDLEAPQVLQSYSHQEHSQIIHQGLEYEPPMSLERDPALHPPMLEDSGPYGSPLPAALQVLESVAGNYGSQYEDNSDYGQSQSSSGYAPSTSGYSVSDQPGGGYEESKSTSGYGVSDQPGGGYEQSRLTSGYGASDQSGSGYEESRSTSGNGQSEPSSGYRQSESNSGYGQSESSSGYRPSESSSGYRQSESSSGYRQSESNSGYGQSESSSGYRPSESSSGYRPSESSSGYGQSESSSGYGQSQSSSGYGQSQSGSGYGQSESSSGYGQSESSSGYDQSQSSSGYDDKPPSRPAYPSEEDDRPKPPCKDFGGHYEPRPPLSVPIIIPEGPKPFSTAYDQYQGGVQVAPPQDYPQPIKSGPSYRSNENFVEAATNVRKSFEEKRPGQKPFYIVIFQKQKMSSY